MLAVEHLGWGGLDLSQLIVSSFVGYYFARRSLCEIINSTLGMLIHRWFTDGGGHFISHLHQTQE